MRRTYAHENMHANCGRDNGRTTPLRDLANVTYNFNGLAAFGERCDNTFLRLEEGCLAIILYVEEDYMR